MFYNDNDKILIPRLPRNLIKPDNTVFFDFNSSDADTLSDYGFYTVRSDSVKPNDNCVEDESKRIINLDKPHADITRFWVDNGGE